MWWDDSVVLHLTSVDSFLVGVEGLTILEA